MDIQLSEEKLTPAARQALNELVEEYRNQILLTAEESASSLVGEVREISVRDILSSVSGARRRLRRDTAPFLEMLLNVGVIGGTVVGATVLLLFLLRNVTAFPRLEDRFMLFLTTAMFAVAMLSYSALRLRAPVLGVAEMREPMGPRELPDFSGEFIARWRLIELGLRYAVASNLGESVANEPISILVERLTDRGFLDRGDEARLQRLLDMRNQIVHKGVLMRGQDVAAALHEADKVLQKLTAAVS